MFLLHTSAVSLSKWKTQPVERRTNFHLAGLVFQQVGLGLGYREKSPIHI